MTEPEDDAYAAPPPADAVDPWSDPSADSAIEVEPGAYFGDDAATLGDRIAAARQGAGLTQTGLASRLGVSAKIISSWENDRSEPRANRLAMLAGMLNVSVTWLLNGGGEGVDPPEPSAQANAKTEIAALVLPLTSPDVAEMVRFYGDVLGCPVRPMTDPDATGGREISFFGHRLALTPADQNGSTGSLTLQVTQEWEAWNTLCERLRTESASFQHEPEIRCIGASNEHATMSIADPDGNVVTFFAARHGDYAEMV